jgi:hypothetical protein
MSDMDDTVTADVERDGNDIRVIVVQGDARLELTRQQARSLAARLRDLASWQPDQWIILEDGRLGHFGFDRDGVPSRVRVPCPRCTGRGRVGRLTKAGKPSRRRADEVCCPDCRGSGEDDRPDQGRPVRRELTAD